MFIIKLYKTGNKRKKKNTLSKPTNGYYKSTSSNNFELLRRNVLHKKRI